MIERWLAAVRDHPDRPPAMQRHVLAMLALRLDWTTGAGFVSTGQLVTDSDAEERTIRRATSWARQAGLLLQTRRGHRLGNGQIIASEWQLSQPVTGDTLRFTSTGQNGHLNRSAAHHHQESSTSTTANRSRPASQGQGQDQDPDSGEVGARSVTTPARRGRTSLRSVANSHNPRVHHGPEDPSSDDQQRAIPVTHQGPAADRNAREAAS